MQHLADKSNSIAALGNSTVADKPESGVVLARDYFATARKFQHPLKTIMKNQEQHCQLESKTLLQIKDRYKNNNLYHWHDKARAEGKRAQLRNWRQEMKQVEDFRKFRKMYDRIGKGDKTLVQERDVARNDSKLRNKKRFSIVSHER